MDIILFVSATLLTIASIGSGIGKYAKVPSVVAMLRSVGVKDQTIPLLATLEVLGGLGIVLGIWIKSLGTLSAICLALYFLGAFSSHLRKKHGLSEFGPSLFLLIVSIITSYHQFIR